MAAAPQSFYELYRRSSIGLALTDMLDDLISEERIHPQLAMKILANFDQAITEALQKSVKARLTFKVRTTDAFLGSPPHRLRIFPSNIIATNRGSLSTYRFCDEVWTFLIKNVQFKLDSGGQMVSADKVKIVSCNSKKPGEGP
ncbi:unnamed protein product [Colletotrichum noveboracense]|uniref:Transcription initiation factor IIA subunit 2 n=1 Tax=Colletotrichum noveboracense TaxID=2664923 RepID=A0A9W4RPS9_9PEZI|nr:unnamed protein product [Colletotrichum noveboracense]